MSKPTSSNTDPIPPSLSSPHALTHFHTHTSDLPQPLRVPHDYARFHPSLGSPSSWPKNRIVGLLACQRDPYLRELSSRVVRVGRAGKGVVDGEEGKSRASREKGKKAKGGKAVEEKEENGGTNGAAAEEEVWEVEFEDTVLFPEGGGQPNDTGLLFPTPSPSALDGPSYRVINVIRQSLSAVHLVSLPKGVDGEKVFELGKEVGMRVDWERRWDHMTQHTAQHLLSSLLDTHLSLPTLSWALPSHPSLDPCYVELPRGLTREEAEEMERKCNELVSRGWGGAEGGAGSWGDLSEGEGGKMEGDTRVWIESRLQGGSTVGSGAVTPAVNGKGDSVDLSKEIDGLGLNGNGTGAESGAEGEAQAEWGNRESRGLPKDYAGGVIRTAVIDGIDRSLCCGTHQPFLSRIQFMHILPITSKPSSKPTRLYMLAGARAHRHLLETSRDLSACAATLALNRNQVKGRLEQKVVSDKEAGRLAGRVKEALAGAEGRAIEWKQGEGGVWNGYTLRKEEGTHDFEFGTSMANHAIDGLKKREGEGVKYCLTIVATPDQNWANYKTQLATGALVLILSNPAELAKNLGDGIKTALDGLGEKGRIKGGGAKGRFMGKVTGGWAEKEEVAAFPDWD